ncbi:Abc transporter a family member 2 [Globisporangium polare]
MATRGTLGALLTKNWIIKKRHPFATLSEVLNPLLCILLFAALKTLEQDLDVPSGWATAAKNDSAALSQGLKWNLFAKQDLLASFLNATSASNNNISSNGSSLSAQMGWTSALSLASGLVVPQFYFTETTMPSLLLNLALQSIAEGDRLDMLSCFLKFVMLGYTSVSETSLYTVPMECRNKVVPYKIAVTPDTTYTRKYFAALLDTWYPRLPLIKPVAGISALQIASFRDSRVFFDNESALETYITSESYGLDLAHPKIYAAIAFHEFPQQSSDIGDLRGHDIEYSLRLNSTYTDTNFPGSVPRTIGKRFNVQKLNKEVKPIPTLCYATRGFMTLQTTVSRFLNCMPTWDSKTETTNGTCQIAESTAKDDDSELDSRLLGQLKDDLILGSALKALEGVREAVLSSTSSSSLSETLSLFMGPIKNLSISVDDIPANTKAQLLQSLRQAPQAFHGAATFMSPIQGFHYAGFFDKILVVFPVGFILSYLYSVSRVIVALLMEKETRSRELMRILGVQETHILFAWFVTYLQLLLFASLLQTLGARALLFPNSDFALLFGFFFSFALSSFGYGFLVSSLFSRARAGSFVGMGIFFMMFFASFGFSESSGELQRTWACLLSPVALAQGINIITQVEAIGVGINTVNANELVGGFRFVNAIWMQMLDFFLYVLIGLYFERVTPREFGVADKWYFCLTKSHWQRVLRSSARATTASAMTQYGTGDGSTEASAQGSCETVSSEMKQQECDGRAVVIRSLRKEFDVPGGKKVAVKGLSLSFYEGQITCLLGYNGAGKTTLMSMLTGMVPPSSGDAWIRGHSVANDMPAVRRSLGYCPQHSVVYPELTVEEHLLFYGQVKGLCDPVTLKLEVNKKIDEVGLSEKRHVRSHALSGGMKRKLSLAIAFLGDSRVVFLDEPTSGMDPYSRRSTWELIQGNRRERVLILTTHFMDEADILGDRIAIMAEGELKCVGSSLFLKNRFGVGYRLSFVQAQKANSMENNRPKASAEAKVLQALILKHVPEARADTDVGSELTFQLPFECASRFPALFEEIEAKQQALGILSFAISVTTLEEIFLRVAEGKQPGHLSTPPGDDNEAQSYQPRQSLGSRSSVGWFFIQIAALLRKRILSARRDRSMLFFSTILPIVIVFVGLSALKGSLFIQNDPKVMLTSESQYDLGVDTPVPYSCTGSSSSPTDPWCTAIVQPQYFSGGDPYALPLEPVVYASSTSPTVFNVTYTDPSIQPNDTTGFCLRFGELAFTKGYGHDSSTLAAQMTPVEGQNGGFVLHGSKEKQVLGYNVMVNSSSTHGGPLYKAMVDESIHRFLLSSQLDSSSAVATANRTLPSVRVATHPFPLSFKTRSIFNSFLSLPAVIFVVIAFTFIPASMMPFLVKEKQSEQNAKHQQLLSGVSLAAYWLANFVFDMSLYLVPMGAAILLLRSYGITSSLSSSGNTSTGSTTSVCQGCTRDVPEAVLALFLLFGGAIAPWTYLMSHIMRDPGACLLYTVMLNFFLGLLLLITSYSLDSLTSTQQANQVLIYLWRCSPLFSLGNGLLRVIVADIEALYGLSRVAKSAFSPEIAGNEIAYLAAECPIFFILALVVDWVQTGDLAVNTGGQGISVTTLSRHVRQFVHRCHCRVNAKLHAQERTQLIDADDEDVKAEAHKVLRANAPPLEPSQPLAADQPNEDEVVQLLNLQKTYPNGKKAVSNLSFGLTRGDCFGFLGINGAGKTTTMKILTGDIQPSSGSAKLNGLDILTQRAKVRRCVGYCPQFDALLELLTVREHLEFYGRLKGFDATLLRNEVDRLLQKLQLKVFESKLAGSLSGGNKRKLSVAIAMLGGPDLLFLDEPSTGMDPHARRFMWDVILEVSVQSKQTTVMLTTHSMEECEALCNKAAIMVGGRLRCFGSIPHLKARFGDGFLLECKLHCPTQEDILRLCESLSGALPGNTSVTGGITVAQIPGLCAALGKPERVDWITGAGASQHPTGSLLQLQLLRKDKGVGALDAREFCGWWLLEDHVEQLTSYLHTHFGEGNTALLERQADFVRFKLTNKHSEPSEDSAPHLAEHSGAENRSTLMDNFRLSRMFELVETEKQRLFVQEYSISQTSLEQIFNSFARQQQEETRVANGLLVE